MHFSDDNEEDLYSAPSEEAEPDLRLAKWPRYRKRSRRKETFQGWPKPLVNVDDLVEAGMFYKGIDDKTECYYCGIPLRLWEIHDVPWIEHARFSPKCGLLRLRKGKFFIAAALDFYGISHSETPTPDLDWLDSFSVSSVSSTVLSDLHPTKSNEHQAPAENTKPPEQQAAHMVMRTVEPRVIRARLDTRKIQKILSFGYPRELVGQVIGEKLQTTGDDFANSKELVTAVLRAAEGLGIPLHKSWQRYRSSRPVTSSNVHGYAQLTTAAYPASAAEHQPFSKQETVIEENRSQSGVSPPSSVKEKQQAATRSKASAERQGNASESTHHNEAVRRAAFRENKLLKQKLHCKICRKKEVNIVLDCGHMVLCEGCAAEARHCPSCGRYITERLKVFLP